MITSADVISWLGITQNLEPLDVIVPAVNRFVDALPQIDRNPAGQWEGTAKLAAIMLASRWYRRRNSPGGLESSVGDVASFVSRYDSDIARMLHIDGFEKPDVG